MCVYIYIYVRSCASAANVELGVECCRFGSWSCVLNFVVRAVHCRGFLSRRATRSATRRDIGATRHKVAQPTTCPSSPELRLAEWNNAVQEIS